MISIGRANEVTQDVLNNPALFGSVFNGLYDNEPVVRMRSADVIEKVTQTQPELLDAYTSSVISVLKSVEQQEICWHRAQTVPRPKCNIVEENEIFELLKGCLLYKSKIVQVSVMESLIIIVKRNNSNLDEVVKIINRRQSSGSPAIKVRGRKLLQRVLRK